MRNRIDLLAQGGSVNLPSPERSASISVETIDDEQFVKLEVESSRQLTVARLVRLDDVVAFHPGIYTDDANASSKWITGKQAKRRLQSESNLTGFVAVSAHAHVLLQIDVGTTAADSLAVDEFSILPQTLFSRSCTCICDDRG